MTLPLSPSSFLNISVPMLVGQILGAVLYGVAGVLLLRVRKGEKGVVGHRLVGVLCLLYAIAAIGVIIVPTIRFMFMI